MGYLSEGYFLKFLNGMSQRAILSDNIKGLVRTDFFPDLLIFSTRVYFGFVSAHNSAHKRSHRHEVCREVVLKRVLSASRIIPA